MPVFLVTAGARFIHALRRCFAFYRDGFRGMTVGRSLWLVITIKVVIIFGVLKLFFFPDFLETRFDTASERSDYVLEQLTTVPPTQAPPQRGDAHD